MYIILIIIWDKNKIYIMRGEYTCDAINVVKIDKIYHY